MMSAKKRDLFLNSLEEKIPGRKYEVVNMGVNAYRDYMRTPMNNLKESGVEVVDCLSVFKTKTAEGKRIFRGVHPSPLGQDLIGTEVYYYLAATGSFRS